MSRVERGFHSLATVERLEVPTVTFELNLPPYVDTSKLGVNMRRIQTMMRLGGIRNLRVLGTSGETSSVTPSIVGSTSDGNAFAGGIAEEKKFQAILFLDMHLKMTQLYLLRNDGQMQQ